MALINVGASWPAPMWATIRLLAMKQRPITVNEARALLSPPTLPSGAEDMFGNAVSTLQTLRLVNMDGEKISRAGAATNLDGTDYSAFIHVLRNAVLHRDLNSDLGSNSNQDGPRDLVRALCWFLTHDPLRTSLHWDNVQQLQVDALKPQVGPAIINGVRWTRFTFWATALGFGNAALPTQGTANQIVPDCTSAIKQTVLSLWKPGSKVGAADFLTQLREAMPVLPGGSYSIDVGLESSGESTAGPAVSFALLRGVDEDWLQLERDADAQQFLRVQDQDVQSFSSVTIKDSNA
ncbi:hypothetical protein SAMN05421833_15122 [Microbispora rosea]|uniref:Uncharacterized protein n=1 Tax=Microbispora rosea TaxID=58117 RepID=A0A1N7HI32_9ACTN|nr:protein DpdG [Microbispora rosea]GIH51960.1 hypothetical protein Mro03_71390 [Microbispora rosea subsp. rosea]SIS24433.1 hypothetical protein SAMN05421833_15122 [Microbispora rosea]